MLAFIEMDGLLQRKRADKDLIVHTTFFESNTHFGIYCFNWAAKENFEVFLLG